MTTAWIDFGGRVRVGFSLISIPGMIPARIRTRSTLAGWHRPLRSVGMPRCVSSAAISRRERAAPISKIVGKRTAARRWAAACCSAALVTPAGCDSRPFNLVKRPVLYQLGWLIYDLLKGDHMAAVMRL